VKLQFKNFNKNYQVNFNKNYQVSSDNIGSSGFYGADVNYVYPDGKIMNMYHNPFQKELKQLYLEKENAKSSKDKNEDFKIRERVIRNMISKYSEDREEILLKAAIDEVINNKIIGILRFQAGGRRFGSADIQLNKEDIVIKNKDKIFESVRNMSFDVFKIYNKSDNRASAKIALELLPNDPHMYAPMISLALSLNLYNDFFVKTTGRKPNSMMEVVEFLNEEVEISDSSWKELLDLADGNELSLSLDNSKKISTKYVLPKNKSLKVTEDELLEKSRHKIMLYNKLKFIAYVKEIDFLKDRETFQVNFLLDNPKQNRDWMSSGFKNKIYSVSYTNSFFPKRKFSSDLVMTFDFEVEFELKNTNIQLNESVLATCGDSSSCWVKLIKETQQW
jgi:hypothetical protein